MVVMLVVAVLVVVVVMVVVVVVVVAVVAAVVVVVVVVMRCPTSGSFFLPMYASARGTKLAEELVFCLILYHEGVADTSHPTAPFRIRGCCACPDLRRKPYAPGRHGCMTGSCFSDLRVIYKSRFNIMSC